MTCRPAALAALLLPAAASAHESVETLWQHRWAATAVGALLLLALAAGTIAALREHRRGAALERARAEADAERARLRAQLDLVIRHASDTTLRESEARFRATFEGAGVGIALLDAEGRIREANPALRAITGSSEGELRGRELAEMAALEPETQRGIRSLFSGEREVLEVTCRCHRPDGTVADVVLRARAERGASGRTERVVALVEDVSERKRLEAQLFLADRLASVGTLAAGDPDGRRAVELPREPRRGDVPRRAEGVVRRGARR
ncbi:MAG TPA: PAS domain S-box protein, partial [Anaeromyxobacteraceae bacterium]|nr:PAS domain S-box protein [Anaeromyxobacteraceae bacterium]